jgi:hypothetical protein
MAVVPYTGTQDVSPQVEPLSQVHLDTPNAAFGGAVAGAITHMGEVTQGAGKELFARAYAMQELAQQDETNAAVAGYQNDLNQKLLEFAENRGQDAKNALPGFSQETEDLRQKYAKDLGSDYARQLFNQESRQSRFRTIFSAGAHARTEMRSFGQEQMKLKSDAIGNTLAVNGTTDGPEFDQSVEKIRKLGGQYVEETKGIHPGDPGYDEAVQQWVSPQVAKVAAAVGRTDSSKGRAMLDRTVKAGLVQPRDALPLGDKLDSMEETKGAQKVAHLVARGDPKYWGNEAVPDSVAVESLKGSPGTSGSFDSKGKDLPDGSHPVGKYGPNSKLVESELPKLDLKDEGGNAVTTEEQFLKSPKAQKAFAETVFPQLQTDNKTYKAAFKAWSGTDDPVRLGGALQSVAKNSNPSVVRDKAREAMAKAAPNSTAGQDNAAELAVNGQVRDRQIDRLSEKRDRDEVVGMISGANTLDGRVPQSLDEALKDPKFADRYNSLPKEDQTAVINILHANSDLGGVRENSVGLNAYQRLKSIMINRDTSSTPKEIDEAANTNLLQLPVSPQHRSELMALQHKVMQGQIANPNMNHAMGLPAVKKLLSDAGIDKANNPKAYEQFTNAFHDAVVSYGSGAERSVKQDEEFTTIAKSLVSDHARTWSGWWQGEKQPYSDLMGSSTKLHKLGETLFSKTYGRALAPDEPQDLENANRLLMQTIYQKYGADTKPKLSNKATP